MKRKYKCDQNNCDKSFKRNGHLKSHKLYVHDIGVTWWSCDNCKKQFKSEHELKQHKYYVHNPNISLYKCDDCGKEFKHKKYIDEHKERAHNVNSGIKCDQKGCDNIFKNKKRFTKHMSDIHNVDIRLYPCNLCDMSFKLNVQLTGHKASVHNIGVSWHKCDQNDCSKKYKRKEHLKTHKMFAHNIDIIWHHCDIDGCDKKYKDSQALIAHKRFTHNIGITWHRCDIENCQSQFKEASALKKHKINIHDIGDFECQLCVKACAKLTKWKDPKTKKNLDICRNCYLKATGHKTRIEKEIVDWLRNNYNQPIIRQDQRVNGEACLKYRPDVMYSCAINNVTIYCEIDEHQHSNTNGSYKCEEKRMSDLYDETPGNLVVFIRYNPHTYVPPSNEAKLKKQERRDLLKDTLNFITTHTEELKQKGMLHVFYICYSSTNKLIAKDIPKQLIYKKQDLGT